MNPPEPRRPDPSGANSEPHPPRRRPLEDHVEAMARELYVMPAAQLQQAQEAFEQLARLAGHYLALQQGSSASLSCAHLCQNGQGSISVSRNPDSPRADDPTGSGAPPRKPD